MTPVIVITVQGGMVTEVNATAPVTVFVEDWDCPLDRPLVTDIESGPLTPDQESRISYLLPETNHSQPDERTRP
jgi:hypothetical protein